MSRILAGYIAGAPWTPKLLEEYSIAERVDLRPISPCSSPATWIQPAATSRRARSACPHTERRMRCQRAKADYSDVWTGMIKDTFFGEQAELVRQYN